MGIIFDLGKKSVHLYEYKDFGLGENRSIGLHDEKITGKVRILDQGVSRREKKFVQRQVGERGSQDLVNTDVGIII
jgi:hypothetical protein